MTSNVFLRNIIAYREPGAKYAAFRTFPHDHNICDSNLVWHGGLPILTGERKAGREISAKPSPPIPASRMAPPNALPTDWQWQIRPTNTASIVTEGVGGGRRALRLGAALVQDKPRDNYPILVSREFSAHPRKELPPRREAQNRPARRQSRAHAPVLYRQRLFLGPATRARPTLGPEWKDVEFVFQVPAPGDKNWHDRMRTFRVRLDWKEASGALFADEISLTEVEDPG